MNVIGDTFQTVVGRNNEDARRSPWRFVAPPPPDSLKRGTVPSFSIAIAAYQAADVVCDAIESALAQTVRPLEIIVCDDGSTDDIATALAPYADRTIVLHEPHRGVGAAKNSAAARASGQFVVILDADNVLLPEYLEALCELAVVRPDLDILTTDAYLELDGQVYARYYRGKAKFALDDQRAAILHNHFIFGNAAIRRSRLLAIGGFDESLECAVDTDCFIRLILDGARAGLVDEPLAVYRLREGSLSSDRARSLSVNVQILERVQREADLAPHERAVLEHDLNFNRRAAALAQAESALRSGHPAARRYSLRIAFGPRGYGLLPRMKAVAAAAAPRTAGAVLEWQERAKGRSHLAKRTRGR
jgi:glycosyltransferase involved in cell wall biosynthesis